MSDNNVNKQNRDEIDNNNDNNGSENNSIPQIPPVPPVLSRVEGNHVEGPVPPVPSEDEGGETGGSAIDRNEANTEPDQRVEGEVELPHQSSDLKPDEVVEAEADLPETEKEQGDEVIVANEDKAPLPEVYNKGVELTTPISGQGPDAETETAADTAISDNKITQPLPPAPASTRAHSEATDDFKTRFRNRLLEMLGRANEKRHMQVEANEEKILAFAREHNRIDNQDVRDLTGYTDNWAREYLDRLEKQGKLVQFGQTGKNVFYKPVK